MTKTLQHKNTQYFLIWLPLVLLVGTGIFYILMSTHAHHMAEEQLGLKQENIWGAFITDPERSATHITGEYDLVKGNATLAGSLDLQRDTAIYYPDCKDWIPFKILTRQYVLNGQPYLLTTYVSSKEITHLIIKVFIAEVFVFILLLAAIMIINRKSSGLLWQPFYGTLNAVREYDINKNEYLPLTEQTGTSEFNHLNQVITALIGHVNLAYSNQKQFTENAAHELQTPLAIIRSKLELLINSPNLTEETAGLLADITQANDRLSQLNKNLLLLTKIDNHQFPDLVRIPLSDNIHRLIAYYRAYYDGDLPAISQSIHPGVRIEANASLIEILINNLVNNAIVHNLPAGYVHIQLTPQELVIENSGPPVEGSTERLFERFAKGSEQSRTTGLGLSLVKRICAIYQFGLDYQYAQGAHCVTVFFPQA